jgi:hypothetical protein
MIFFCKTLFHVALFLTNPLTVLFEAIRSCVLATWSCVCFPVRCVAGLFSRSREPTNDSANVSGKLNKPAKVLGKLRESEKNNGKLREPTRVSRKIRKSMRINGKLREPTKVYSNPRKPAKIPAQRRASAMGFCIRMAFNIAKKILRLPLKLTRAIIKLPKFFLQLAANFAQWIAFAPFGLVRESVIFIKNKCVLFGKLIKYGILICKFELRESFSGFFAVSFDLFVASWRWVLSRPFAFAKWIISAPFKLAWRSVVFAKNKCLLIGKLIKYGILIGKFELKENFSWVFAAPFKLAWRSVVFAKNKCLLLGKFIKYGILIGKFELKESFFWIFAASGRKSGRVIAKSVQANEKSAGGVLGKIGSALFFAAKLPWTLLKYAFSAVGAILSAPLAILLRIFGKWKPKKIENFEFTSTVLAESEHAAGSAQPVHIALLEEPEHFAEMGHRTNLANLGHRAGPVESKHHLGLVELLFPVFRSLAKFAMALTAGAALFAKRTVLATAFLIVKPVKAAARAVVFVAMSPIVLLRRIFRKIRSCIEALQAAIERMLIAAKMQILGGTARVVAVMLRPSTVLPLAFTVVAYFGMMAYDSQLMNIESSRAIATVNRAKKTLHEKARRARIPAYEEPSSKRHSAKVAAIEELPKKIPASNFELQKIVDDFFSNHRVSEVMCEKGFCKIKIDGKVIDEHSVLGENDEIYIFETDGDRIVFADAFGNKYAKSIDSLFN